MRDGSETESTNSTYSFITQQIFTQHLLHLVSVNLALHKENRNTAEILRQEGQSGTSKVILVWVGFLQEVISDPGFQERKREMNL